MAKLKRPARLAPGDTQRQGLPTRNQFAPQSHLGSSMQAQGVARQPIILFQVDKVVNRRGNQGKAGTTQTHPNTGGQEPRRQSQMTMKNQNLT